jgi:hypothetical protein
MLIVSGYKEGAMETDQNKRLFLYPTDDIEALCNEMEATLGSSYERRPCMKYDIESEEIKEGNACVLRIMGYLHGELVDKRVILEVIDKVSSRKKDLPEDYRNPRFEFRYPDLPDDTVRVDVFNSPPADISL